MKVLLMPQRDSHKYTTRIADLSKQLEKGHKRYSCLIYIFPQVISVLKGTGRGMEPHLCRQPSNRRGSGCSPGQGQVPLPLGGSMSCRSSGAMSQLCPLVITAGFQTSPPSLCIKRERGFSKKKSQKSQKLPVGFSRIFSTQGNSCPSLGTAQTSGLLHLLRKALSPMFGSAQHLALGWGTAALRLLAGSTLGMPASLSCPRLSGWLHTQSRPLWVKSSLKKRLENPLPTTTSPTLPYSTTLQSQAGSTNYSHMFLSQGKGWLENKTREKPSFHHLQNSPFLKGA